MANILAAANGNFNATSTWIGGVVPTVGDTAYLNNRTITITADITCDKISNLAENGATAGGTCNLAMVSTDNRVISANLESTTATLINISETSAGGLVTINGYLRNFTSRTVSFGVSSLSSRLIVNGHLYAGSSFNNSALFLGIGTITINGNLYGPGQHPGGGGPTGQSYALGGQFGLCNLTINGDLYPGPNNNCGSLALFNNSNNQNSLVTINGNITGATGISSGVNISQGATGGTLILNGNCIGTTNTSTNFFGSGILLTSNSNAVFNVTINGNCVGNGNPGLFVSGNNGVVNVRKAIGNDYGPGSTGISVPMEGVINSSQAIIYIRDMECGLRGVPPFRGPVYLDSASTSYFKAALSASTSRTLVNPSSVVTPPAVTDVRSGVVYNAGNLTGTCAVPAASSVAAGVPVDNTVGTAALTPASVWDYALSSASGTAGSVGEKLKKTAIPADIIALG